MHEAAQGRDASRRVVFASQLTHYQSEAEEAGPEPAAFTGEDGLKDSSHEPERERQPVQAFKVRACMLLVGPEVFYSARPCITKNASPMG